MFVSTFKKDGDVFEKTTRRTLKNIVIFFGKSFYVCNLNLLCSFYYIERIVRSYYVAFVVCVYKNS